MATDNNLFFEHPVINSPYEYPERHWELDEAGQPTQEIKNTRRRASFVTPIPKPKKKQGKSGAEQLSLLFDEKLDTQEQQYDQNSVINSVREAVDKWRNLPQSQWKVTAETARLLEYWRHHEFNSIRPFFCQIEVKILGVDVYHPNSGTVESDGPDGIACWFIDSDYNEEAFFVRHAYFLGANDPYAAPKTSLKAEINKEAWESLHSDISRPFDKPSTGRIAVKVINHLGDEVLKVFRID